MEKTKSILFLVLMLLVTACDAASPAVQNPVGIATATFSAYIETPWGTRTFLERNVNADVISDKEGYLECRILDKDWEVLEKEQEEVVSKREPINKHLKDLFGGVDIIYAGVSGGWHQQIPAIEDNGEYSCDHQDFSFYVQESFGLAWKEEVVTQLDDLTTVDSEEPVNVSLTYKLGDYYLDIATHNNSKLSLAFKPNRIFNIVEGVLQNEPERVQEALQVPVVSKDTNSIVSGQEKGSFVVDHEDFMTRDIFVKIIEAVLPVAVDGPSVSFLVGTTQSGQESTGGFTGSQNGDLIGMSFSGWGFITGSLESSISGSFESKPVLYIRGNIYVSPNP